MTNLTIAIIICLLLFNQWILQTIQIQLNSIPWGHQQILFLVLNVKKSWISEHSWDSQVETLPAEISLGLWFIMLFDGDEWLWQRLCFVQLDKVCGRGGIWW